MAERKNIVILGSSGSIGENSLDVVRRFKNRLRVIGLSVNANIQKLNSQVEEFRPEYVAVGDEASAKELPSALRRRTKVLVSMDGISKLASLKAADVVLIAISGSDALLPLLSAIHAKKTILLANKESLVVAGELVTREAKKNKVRIIPIDSEQNAIFQCLQGYEQSMVERVYLTASGGSLLDYSAGDIENASLEKVLDHPRWRMGKKITVDSATMMNKGFEVIEARHLFDLKLEQIKVLIHRKALIHSMVEFLDGSILAQMAVTDMRVPIQYALSYPERWRNSSMRLDPLTIGDLSFSKPDQKKFPCLALAYEAARLDGLVPCALNAANEVAVQSFLKGQLPFGSIYKIIEKVVLKDRFPKTQVSLNSIFKTDKEARASAQRWVNFYMGKRGH